MTGNGAGLLCNAVIDCGERQQVKLRGADTGPADRCREVTVPASLAREPRHHPVEALRRYGLG